MGLINISVCLTDLPKDKIKLAANGKKYINLCLSGRKETGKYGETHTLFVSQTKEERQANTPILLCRIRHRIRSPARDKRKRR
ncbi:MAG: hypothetical protein LBG96_03160 [Tannerella sp.]|nr:hypothetical protein [Tannerella sp.]